MSEALSAEHLRLCAIGQSVPRQPRQLSGISVCPAHLLLIGNAKTLLFTASFVVVTLLVCTQARAGQTAPRLAGLFEEQRLARDETEPAITRLWLQASEPQWTQQLAEAKKEIESAPQFAETWNLRATLHYIERDYDASLADVDRTLALEPHHFGALAGLGEIRRKQGELGGALSAFKRAFAVHPYFPQAKVRVSALRERLREQ